MTEAERIREWAIHLRSELDQAQAERATMWWPGLELELVVTPDGAQVRIGEAKPIDLGLDEDRYGLALAEALA